MRKSAKCVLATLLMFCFAGNVKAAECSYDKQVELNNQAATVKAIYEEVEIDTGETKSYVDPETGIIDTENQIAVKVKGFKVNIMNITNDIMVKVNGSNYYYSDTNNGTLTLPARTADEVRNYDIKISAYGGDCAAEDLRTINLVTPMYNYYSELNFCKENPDFEYCQEYVTIPVSDNLDEFLNKAGNYSEKNNGKEVKKEDKKSFVDILKENKTIVIISVSGIMVVGVATAAIIVIKRRSRLI